METSGPRPAQSPGWELFAHWHDLIEGGDSRFTALASVQDVTGPLERLLASTTSSMWNMQRHVNIHSLRTSAPLDLTLRRRRVDMRYVLPRRVAERRCPLVSSHEPELRLAPVAHPLLIADGRLVVVGDSTGESVWTSVDPGVVGRAAELFERVWSAAERPVPEGEEPPFTRRMVDIAFHLVDGATDREIARALGVSERTVSGDVREMSDRLGARSRTHAIAIISGING